MKKTKKLKKTKKSIKHTEFEIASHDKVTVLDKYVTKIIKALGHSEFLVTDESLVSDFMDIFDKEERIKQAKKAKKILKVDIFPGDYIWEVAERMKEG